jgi:SHS2 domain-containing protein
MPIQNGKAAALCDRQLHREEWLAMPNVAESSSSASPSAAGWSHFAHDADIGIRGWGATLASAFEQAAMALTAAVTSAEVRCSIEVTVHCQAPDIELLFVEWLNAIIYEMAVRRMLFGRSQARIEGTHLEGMLWGEPVDVARHAPASEPKGATYTSLEVHQDGHGQWSAACVVDV